MRTRILLTVLVALAGIPVGVAPAGADIDNTAGAYTGGEATADGARVVVALPGGSTMSSPTGGYGGGSGAAASTISCAFFRGSGSQGAFLPGVGEQVTDTSTIEEGAITWLVCREIGSGDITFENLFPWDPANPPILEPSAADLAQIAVNDIRLPRPGVRTWPPSGGSGLVNLPVWLHVENWAPLTASASAGGLTATVEATPVRVEWDMDDGSVTCDGAGSVYDASASPTSSECSFTYRRSSGVRSDLRFHNSSRMVWHLQWTATNGEGGDLGEMAGPLASFDLRIEESQALIVPSDN